MDDEQSYDRGIVGTSLRSAGFELDAQLNQLLSTVTFPANLPILPAKDIVAFPSVTLSLHITRDSSVRAVEKALMDNKYIFVVGQKEGAIDQSDAKSFYQIKLVTQKITTDMKNFIKIFRISLVAVVISLFSVLPVLAQNGPPPPPGNGHDQSGNQPPAGGGAPIGEGILILSLLGAAYGVRKWRVGKNDQEV